MQFLLSPPALGFLPMLILHLLILGYLLSWRQKSTATWLLIGWQSCLLLLMASLFFARTVYAPESVYLEWLGGTTFATLGALFMIQFAYHFPRSFYPREARLLLVISGLVWLGLVGLMIAEAMTNPGVLNYHFEGFLYGFFIPPGEKQGLASFDIFDLLHPLAFIWTLSVWLRQSVRLSRAEEQPQQAGWWQLLSRPRSQAAVATRNFALLFVAALLAVIISTLEARSYLPDGTFATAYLLAWFVFILVYINSAPEATSFMARLVGITLVTLLVIVGLVNPLLLTWYDRAHEQARQTELAYLQRLLSHNDWSQLPEPVQYLLARPAAGGPFSTSYQLLYARQAGLTAQDFIEADARLQEFLEQGVQQPLVREHPWLSPELLRLEEDLAQTAIPARTRLYRGIFATAEFHFIRYTVRQSGTLYEVGYSYPAYRLALHRQALPLAGLTGLTVVAILFAFPLFFRHNLIHPLENLLQGVKQVNQGDLTVAIPVDRQDEIGFLTRSFNQMVQSLQGLNANLRREIGERVQTERSLRDSEARFRRVLTSISDHLYMSEITPGGSRENLYISPNVENLTGYPRAKFDDDWHFWPSQVIHPEDQTAAAAHAARLTAGQAGEIEYRLIKADGRIIWVRDSGRSERIGDKVIIYGVVSDITDRKQAEAEREQALARQAASARENARLFEAARQATARLAEAEESERQQLARELHDRVGQNLTALSLNLTTMSTYLSTYSTTVDPVEMTGQLRARLEDSKELVKETTQRIRSVMDELRSPVLEEYGLLAALRWYGKQFGQRSGLAVTVGGELPEPRPSATVENTFFRIAQEALTNTAKHAQASQVTITLAAEEGRLRMVIADDGRGFSRSENEITPDERRPGLGLLTIAERAEAVGGHCLVETAPGQGTQVIVEVEL